MGLAAMLAAPARADSTFDISGTFLNSITLGSDTYTGPLAGGTFFGWFTVPGSLPASPDDSLVGLTNWDLTLRDSSNNKVAELKFDNNVNQFGDLFTGDATNGAFVIFDDSKGTLNDFSDDNYFQLQLAYPFDAASSPINLPSLNSFAYVNGNTVPNTSIIGSAAVPEPGSTSILFSIVMGALALGRRRLAGRCS